MGQREEKQHFLLLLLCVISLDVLRASVCLHVVWASSQRWFRPQERDVGDRGERWRKKGSQGCEILLLRQISLG